MSKNISPQAQTTISGHTKVWACVTRGSRSPLWDALAPLEWQPEHVETLWTSKRDACDHCDRMQSVGMRCKVVPQDLYTRKGY